MYILKPCEPILYSNHSTLGLTVSSHTFFASGRTALYFGLKALGLQPRQFILIPNFICEAVLDTVSRLGLITIRYSLTENLEPNWNSLDESTYAHASAMLLVHFFGQPANVMRAKELCTKNGWYLIEDNAHGYGASFNKIPLGEFGDIGISSPRKTVNVPCGGMLITRTTLGNKLLDEYKELKKHKYSLTRWWVKKKLKESPSLWRLFRSFRTPIPYQEVNGLTDNVINDERIDDLSFSILDSPYFLNEMAFIRRIHYQAWATALYSTDLKPVFDTLNSGSSPWCFPAYAPSMAARNEWLQWGSQAGFNVFSWPILPREDRKQTSDAWSRWSRLVCFEIDPHEDVARLERAISRKLI